MENILKKYKLEIFFTLLSLGLFIYSILYGTPNKIMDLKRLQTLGAAKCLKTVNLNTYKVKLSEFETVLKSTLNTDSNYNKLSTNIESIRKLLGDNDCNIDNKCNKINNDYIWNGGDGKCICSLDKPVLFNGTCMTVSAAANASLAVAAKAAADSDTLLTSINNDLVKI